jgi:hypothetical protein
MEVVPSLLVCSDSRISEWIHRPWEGPSLGIGVALEISWEQSEFDLNGLGLLGLIGLT